MSKKVLIISSTPRKGGNSDILCDEFQRGAQEAGNEVEKIFLRDKKINYCSGCGYCNTNDYTACSQKDDMNEILEKIVNADVIVMATPVYFYTMCGQMKTFIDRWCARYTHIIGKEFYFIITAADNNARALYRTLEEYRGLLDCLSSPLEKGVIMGAGVWQKGDVFATDYPKQAYEMGKLV
ncbi:MAG: flavodoxin family protein [Candidatus Gastranaerophilales bacterium]|nr:flavodoxin family protein [Candidatus Gastranaerophilales bacterium]